MATPTLVLMQKPGRAATQAAGPIVAGVAAGFGGGAGGGVLAAVPGAAAAAGRPHRQVSTLAVCLHD